MKGNSREDRSERAGQGGCEGENRGERDGGPADGGRVGGPVQACELARGGSGQQGEDNHQRGGEQNNDETGHDKLPVDSG